jgi:hypothetical protein
LITNSIARSWEVFPTQVPSLSMAEAVDREEEFLSG